MKLNKYKTISEILKGAPLREKPFWRSYISDYKSQSPRHFYRQVFLKNGEYKTYDYKIYNYLTNSYTHYECSVNRISLAFLRRNLIRGVLEIIENMEL